MTFECLAQGIESLVYTREKGVDAEKVCEEGCVSFGKALKLPEGTHTCIRTVCLFSVEQGLEFIPQKLLVPAYEDILANANKL